MAKPGEKLLWDDAKFSEAVSSVHLVTKFFGDRMIEQAGITASYPPDAPLAVFDNACGGGVITATLHDILKDRPHDTYSIQCGDFADAMVEVTRRKIETEGWGNNTRVDKIDAQNTHLPPATFTHILINFGPMLFPSARSALAECHRTLLPGGTLGFTTWIHIGWVEDVKAALSVLHSQDASFPCFPTEDEFRMSFNDGSWDDSGWIRDTVTREHGFGDVQVEAVVNYTRAKGVEEIRPILVPTLGIVTGMYWTEEQRREYGGPELVEKVLKWFEGRYGERTVVWRWVALVTTAVKPGGK